MATKQMIIKKNNGQSIFEYTALAMLVLVGTIVMGPFVIRSVNAHFKLWQEGVQDSVNDRMKSTNDPAQIQCKYSGWLAGGCNAQLTGASAGQCKSNGVLSSPTPPLVPPDFAVTGQTRCRVDQRYYYQEGKPTGCPTCETCISDDTCCHSYVRTLKDPNDNTKYIPRCGRSPLREDPNGTAHYRSNQEPGDNPSGPEILPPGTLEFIPPSVNGNTTNNINLYCYYGEEILTNICYPDHKNPHPGIPPVVCQRNTACNPVCTASPAIPGIPVDADGNATATLCPGYKPYIPENNNFSFIVDPAGTCRPYTNTTDTMCLLKCIAPREYATDLNTCLYPQLTCNRTVGIEAFAYSGQTGFYFPNQPGSVPLLPQSVPDATKIYCPPNYSPIGFCARDSNSADEPEISIEDFGKDWISLQQGDDSGENPGHEYKAIVYCQYCPNCSSSLYGCTPAFVKRKKVNLGFYSGEVPLTNSPIRAEPIVCR